MANMSGMPTREELKQEIAALEKELREREAALPIHSVRPAQFQAIEELEERIRAKREELKDLGGKKIMGTTILSLDDKETMDLEAIIVDRDRDEALRFILKVLEPKLRAKGKGAPDTKKGMGISG